MKLQEEKEYSLVISSIELKQIIPVFREILRDYQRSLGGGLSTIKQNTLKEFIEKYDELKASTEEEEA